MRVPKPEQRIHLGGRILNPRPISLTEKQQKGLEELVTQRQPMSIGSFLLSLDESIQCSQPANRYVIDTGEHNATCFTCRPPLVRNKG